MEPDGASRAAHLYCCGAVFGGRITDERRLFFLVANLRISPTCLQRPLTQSAVVLMLIQVQSSSHSVQAQLTPSRFPHLYVPPGTRDMPSPSSAARQSRSRCEWKSASQACTRRPV